MPRPSKPSPVAETAIEKIRSASLVATPRSLHKLEFTSEELHALNVFIRRRLPIDDHSVRIYHRSHPNASLSEAARAFGRTHGAMKRAAERLGITFVNKQGRR